MLQSIQRTGPDLLADSVEWAGVKRTKARLFPELTLREGLGGRRGGRAVPADRQWVGWVGG